MRTAAAKVIRKLGGGNLIDSPSLRRLFGAPLYKKHLQAPPAARAVAAPTPDSGTAGKLAPPATDTPKPGGSTSVKNAVKAPRPAVSKPLLSVIVPVYNVEQFVRECLESILKQSFTSMEIIVVDDGSSDGSLGIVKELAAKDLRLRYITKANAGLGAARNSGLDLAKAPYITFVDSDDVVLPGAYERMINVIESSGSDVVIGGVQRTDGTKTWVPNWVGVSHDQDRIGITADEFPEILWDVYAWNKIYRRTAWDNFVGRVPENILYEDQECSGKLYTGGAKLDVLEQMVYVWRLRTDGTSITQQKTSLKDLRDRLTVIWRMQNLMDEAEPQVRDYWYAKVLEDDLYWYYLATPRADEQFFAELRDGVRDVYAKAPEGAMARVRFKRRLLTYFMAERTPKEFNRLLLSFDETRSHPQLTVAEDGLILGTTPLLSQLAHPVPREILVIDPAELTGQATLRRYSTSSDASVTISGDARILGLSTTPTAPLLTAELRHSLEPSRTVPLEVQQRAEPLALAEATDPYTDYSNSGYEITLRSDQIPSEDPVSTLSDQGVWVPTLTVHLANGLQFDLPITKKDTRGSAGRLVASPPNRQRRSLIPMSLGDGSLAFRVSPPCQVLVRELTVDGLAVSLSLEDLSNVQSEDDSPWQLTARNLTNGREVTALGRNVGDRIEVLLQFPGTLAPGKDNFEDWECKIGRLGRVPKLISYFPHANDEHGNETLRPVSTGHGYLRLRQQFQFGLIQAVELGNSGKEISIRGSYAMDQSVRVPNPSFALVSTAEVVRPVRTVSDASAGSFEVVFAMERTDVDGRPVTIDSGHYVFQLLGASKQGLPVSAWLPVATPLQAHFPLTLDSPQVRVQLTRTAQASALNLEVKPPLREDERGSVNQNRLIDRFRSVVFQETPSPLEEAVFFESFGGGAIQDSPLALDRELSKRRPDLTRYWTVRSHATAVPEGSIPLVMYSRDWYAALARSKWLVNNNNFPHWFARRADQVYVQTWHGTPLKRIGNDVPPHNLSLMYRALMQREATGYWNYLLAQSPWAAGTLRNAFGYEGIVLDKGYPRNDALVASEASTARREVVRRHFGISPSQFVILYAPTWRDSKKDARGRYQYELYLDPNAVTKALGPDSVVMLRGHANTRATRRGGNGRGVLEVTNYPNINDLMLAADVLVTDYSSTMFDFVVTEKPIVFMVPDLNEYRDKTRGFYVDIEEIAPGPLCKTTGETIEALQGILTRTSQVPERYQAFRESFAGYDDGHAAERVASIVWGTDKSQTQQ